MSYKPEDLEKTIRDVPDFPKPGITFNDITTLLKRPDAYKHAIEIFLDRYREKRIDKVVGIESRGFIFGATLAYELGVGFVPVRKPNKLPAATEKATYELEYGTDTIEIHKDGIDRGEKVLIVDDLLATGGTMAAAVELVEKLGGEILEIACLIELTFLNARSKLNLADRPIFSIIRY